MDVLEKVVGVQILHEFKGQGILLWFLFLLVLGIFVLVRKDYLDNQRVWELANSNELRGKVVCDLSLETVLGPIVSLLGQVEDPAPDALYGDTRSDCDIILEERPLRQLYWEKVGPQLECRSDGAKVRSRGEVCRLDSHLFHAGYKLILRLVRNTGVQSRRHVLGEYARFQVRLEEK